MANYRRRRRSRRSRRRPRLSPATVRNCRSRLLAFSLSRDNDPDDDDDEQQQEYEQHCNDDGYNPKRETRLLFAFGLQLLAALNQAIDFRVLRKQSLYFLKLRNRRRVVLLPVVVESLTINSIRRSLIVRSTGTDRKSTRLNSSH